VGKFRRICLYIPQLAVRALQGSTYLHINPIVMGTATILDQTRTSRRTISGGIVFVFGELEEQKGKQNHGNLAHIRPSISLSFSLPLSYDRLDMFPSLLALPMLLGASSVVAQSSSVILCVAGQCLQGVSNTTRESISRMTCICNRTYLCLRSGSKVVCTRRRDDPPTSTRPIHNDGWPRLS
jgi:hypothetical protein